MSLTDIYQNWKRVCSLKEIGYHLISAQLTNACSKLTNSFLVTVSPTCYSHVKILFSNFTWKIFFCSTAVLKECNIFYSNSVCFIPSCSLQPTNNCFAPLKAISTFKPYCTPLWTIGFSGVTYIKLWWSVKDLEKNALKF